MRDLLELYVLPFMAVFLPWSLCYRLYYRLVKLDALYRAGTEAGLAGVSSFWAVDRKHWAHEARMMSLVDHADLYLSLFRSDRWLARNILVEGNWPDQPFIAITYHWGAGMWALRHIRSQDKKVSVLVRGVDKNTFPGSLLAFAYANLRLAEVTRAGGSKIVIAKKQSLFEMKTKLKQGVSVLGLMDVPVQGEQHYLSTTLFGRQAYFPQGLLYLAQSSNVPVVAYGMGLDRLTGKRLLQISEPLEFSNEQELLGMLAARLEQLIKLDSPAWHHWGGVEGLFRKPEGMIG